MKKLNFLLLTILVSLLSSNSLATPKVYGKINIAADDGDGTDDYVCLLYTSDAADDC